MEYRVKLPAPEGRSHSKTTANRKESSFWQELAVLAPSQYDRHEFKTVATARFYGNGARIYCVIWVNPKDGGSFAGGGFAGGGGYHKPSAALAAALDVAGVSYEYRERKDGFNATRGNPVDRTWTRGGLSGCGDTAMRDVMLALAKDCGYSRARIHKAHA